MRKVVLGALVLMLAVAECGYGQGSASARQPARAATSRLGQSDSQIEANIRAKFAKSKINADRFTVKVQNGVATIEGHTDVIQHKGVATRLAKSGGAIAVNNRIEISEASRKRAADRLEQGRKKAELAKAAK
jgi:osmotically-inducible protein OsmY